jgi:hypothetical protein
MALRCALEVFFIVNSVSNSMFLYDLLLNKFQPMISDQRTSPKSLRILRKEADSSWFSILVSSFELFQSAFFSKLKFIKFISETQNYVLDFALCLFKMLSLGTGSWVPEKSSFDWKLIKFSNIKLSLH